MKDNQYDIEILTGGIGKPGKITIGGVDLSHLIQGISFEGSPGQNSLSVRFSPIASISIKGVMEATVFGSNEYKSIYVDIDPSDTDCEVPLKTIIIRGKADEED